MSHAPALPSTTGLAALPVRRLLEAFGTGLFVLFVVTASFAFMEPSPYDFIAIPTILLWVLLGVPLVRGALVGLSLLLLYNVSLILALLPHAGEPDPLLWTIQSVYLMVTAFFFTMFFCERTTFRMELALKAFTASCLFAAVAAIMGYFDVAGTGALFSRFDRASGPFQDPNVLGSFLILGALYLTHNLLTGHARRPILSLVILPLILAGIFLSFSRGSWGATVVAFALMVGAAFLTSRHAAVRRRIAVLSVVAGMVGAGAVGVLLSVDEVAEKFTKRAQVTQDYDEGETGRFGNQRRGLPMLLERPEGLGPLRWRLIFGLDPHSSYIGSFANGGWPAGFAFLGLVLTTCFVGFRLCFTPSPYQRHAQIVWPALFVFFLQGFQIDIEKWRHVYMMIAMIWALEAMRQRWVGQGRPATPV